MKYLIDSHAFLWYFRGQDELSEAARRIIEDPDNAVYVHPASLWEIAIKASIGKLDVDVAALLEVAEQQSVEVLPHLPNAVITMSNLPFPLTGKYAHKDPFDRMIAASVIANPEYRLVSCDAVFDRYGISRIW